MFPVPNRLSVVVDAGDRLIRLALHFVERVRASAPHWRLRLVRGVNRLRLDSVKSRIVTFAIGATLLPSLATAWIAYSQTRRSITDQISESLESASAQVARELELWSADVLTDIRVFASSYEVTENLERLTRDGGPSISSAEIAGRLHDYLSAVEQRFENYAELRVVDGDGVPFAGSGTTRDTSAFPPAWNDVFRGGAARLGEPYWDVDRESQVVGAVAPVRSPGGVVLGALVATVNLDALLPLMRTFTPGVGGAMHILSARRRPILGLSPDKNPSDHLPAVTDELYAEAPRPIEYVTLSGDRRVGALSPVRGLQWGVVAELPRDVAYGRITGLRNLTIVIVSLILAFVSAVAYYLASVIVKPLNSLTAGAAAVAAGDLDVDLPVLGGGEVGYLTHVFNDMVSRLREGRRQLDDVNDTLTQKNEELARLSNTDSLTGLHNRRYLMDALLHETQRAIRTERPYAVLMIDVDHFKSFNDQYGHQAGDDVLVAVAGVLRRSTRDMDCAARYGGEEFLVMLPETRFDTAGEVAERIRTQVADLVFVIDGSKASVTLSIGLAEYPRHGETFEEVIQAADVALYEAKRGGRDRIIAASESSQKATAG